jgi:hypothetical protein
MKEIAAYECETCGELHHNKNRFYKCEVCGVELCSTCSTEIASSYPKDSYDIKGVRICERCYDDLEEKFVEVCLQNKK